VRDCGDDPGKSGLGFATSTGSGYRASVESCSVTFDVVDDPHVFSHAGHWWEEALASCSSDLSVGWHAAEIPADHDSDGMTCG
jgi:hypothetical protein